MGGMEKFWYTLVRGDSFKVEHWTPKEAHSQMKSGEGWTFGNRPFRNERSALAYLDAWKKTGTIPKWRTDSRLTNYRAHEP